MGGGALDVGTNTTSYVLGLLLAHVFHALGGDADYEAAGRELLVFRDQSTCGDDRTFAYPRPVEDGCAHTDEAPIPYLAPVHYSLVADNAVLADNRRVAGVGMQYAAVLDIGAGSDPIAW